MKVNWGLDEPTTRLLRVIGLVAAIVLLALTVLGMVSLRFWLATALAALLSLFCVVVIVILVRRMVTASRQRGPEAK